MATGIVEHTRRCHRRDGRGPVRRAVIDRRTTETQIALRSRSTARAGTSVRTGIRFLDHMLELFARHGAFDLRIEADGDLDVDQHHTVEDLGIALGEAVSKALGNRRGINRAGYFVMPMDETLAVAAVDLGGRPHAVVDLKVQRRARRRSADRARPRFLRGLRASARAPTSTSRCCTADRAITRSKRCSRRSRARCASPARRTSRSRGCCRAPRGCCDRADRLQGGQPDVGEQGARRDRRGGVRPGGAGGARRAGGDHRAGRRPFRRDARPRWRVGRGDSSRASAKDGRCSASASACSGCTRAATKRPTARASGCSSGDVLPAAKRIGASRSRTSGGTAWHRSRGPGEASRPSSRACRRRAGVLHAQLRRARDRRHRRGHRARRTVCRRSCSAATSPACSSTRRNRATSGCRSSAISSHGNAS